MIHIYWLENLIKKVVDWFKNKEKKENATISTTLASPSSSVSPPASREGSIYEATSVSKKFQNDLERLTDEVGKTKNDAEKALKEVEIARALVAFGFFVMFLMVVGLVVGYWRYVSDSVRKDDYKYGISERINGQKQEIINLQDDTKKLLEIVNCQNTRRYWQYEECFKK